MLHCWRKTEWSRFFMAPCWRERRRKDDYRIRCSPLQRLFGAWIGWRIVPKRVWYLRNCVLICNRNLR